MSVQSVNVDGAQFHGSCQGFDIRRALAIDLIHQTPKFANNAGSCYLHTEKKEAAVVEMGSTGSILRKLEEGTLVASNAFLTPIAEEMKPIKTAAYKRSDLVAKWLRQRKGKADIRLMRTLLSNHTPHVCSSACY